MIQDLDQRFPIANPDGTPSDYFMRLIRDRGQSQADTDSTVTELNTRVDTVETELSSKADKTTTISPGTGLSGGGDLSTNRIIKLADTVVTPGTYGDATHVPQITVDQQGRLTVATNVAISGGSGGLTLIGKITVTGAAAASISFTGIPATFDDLIYSARLRGTDAAAAINTIVRFNNDSAANYDFGGANFNNNATFPATTASTASPSIGVASAAGSINANKFGALRGEIIQYANTAMEKILVGENMDVASNSAATIRRQIWGVNWRSTAAINRVDFIPSAGSFAVGSVVLLYGR